MCHGSLGERMYRECIAIAYARRVQLPRSGGYQIGKGIEIASRQAVPICFSGGNTVCQTPGRPV